MYDIQNSVSTSRELFTPQLTTPLNTSTIKKFSSSSFLERCLQYTTSSLRIRRTTQYNCWISSKLWQKDTIVYTGLESRISKTTTTRKWWAFMPLCYSTARLKSLHVWWVKFFRPRNTHRWLVLRYSWLNILRRISWYYFTKPWSLIASRLVDSISAMDMILILKFEF